MLRWLIGLAILGGLVYFVEGQFAYLTLAGTTGAEGELQRDGDAVPVTLFADIPVAEGHAELTESYRVLFGNGLVFTLPDGTEVRCGFRLSRAACQDGWTFSFVEPTPE